MLALALLIAAATPAAPVSLQLDRSFDKAELISSERSAECAKKELSDFNEPDPCQLSLPSGPVRLELHYRGGKSRTAAYALDLPASGAKISAGTDGFTRGESFGYALSLLLEGFLVAGVGAALHSTPVEIVGASLGGLGAIGITVVLAVPPKTFVTAHDNAGQPIPVHAIELTKKF